MARFEPFPGVRYDPVTIDLDEVTAPPYDVVAPERREALAARHHYNAVHLDLPVPDLDAPPTDTDDPYRRPCELLSEWRRDGVLVTDEPSLYVYRMSFVDDLGRQRHTTGVVGALELAPSDGPPVLPHEQTTPKAKSDRLRLLRSCRANLSAIWCLSLASGLTKLLQREDEPISTWTASDGTRHELWQIEDAATQHTVSEAIASAPVLIADGHHRYETATAYRAERRAAVGDEPGPHDLTMALLVELVEDELTVLPIHRVVTGLPPGAKPAELLSELFELSPGPTDVDGLARVSDEPGALAVVTPDRTLLARPRAGRFADVRDLDTSRVDHALASFPPHDLHYQHGVANVVDRVRSGAADLGVIVGAVTIDQIAETAHGGERMPPKTTFFHPKPSTGFVYRLLDLEETP